MNEKSQDKDYVNKSTMLVGHWGYSIGARTKFNGPNFGIGFVGEVSWIGDTFERQLSEGGDFFRYCQELATVLDSISESPMDFVFKCCTKSFKSKNLKFRALK